MMIKMLPLSFLLAALMAKEKVVKEAITETAPPEVFTQLELPSVIQELYPDLLPHEIEQVRSGLLQSMYINQQGGLINQSDLPPDAEIVGGPSSTSIGGQALMRPRMKQLPVSSS